MCLGIANGYIEPTEMTDKGIIKALETAIAFSDEPIGDKFLAHISTKTAKVALDLINRQQAEIERLKKGWKADVIETENIKAEVIKEYIDKLLINLEYNYHLCSQDLITLIKDTVKEMVGEEK